MSERIFDGGGDGWDESSLVVTIQGERLLVTAELAGDPIPVLLERDEVRQLRDALTEWLDQPKGGTVHDVSEGEAIESPEELRAAALATIRNPYGPLNLRLAGIAGATCTRCGAAVDRLPCFKCGHLTVNEEPVTAVNP